MDAVYKGCLSSSRRIFIPTAESTETRTMRVVTIISMALTVALALLVRCCEGASLRGFVPDEEELRPNMLYHEYGLIRNRPIRNDEAFDDYGHLRFGRSYD